MRLIWIRTAAVLMVAGSAEVALSDDVIATGLSSDSYAADFSTSGSAGQTGGRWTAVFAKSDSDAGPAVVQGVLWSGPGTQVETIGPWTSGDGYSEFLVREGLWIAARPEQAGNLIGTISGGVAGPLQTPCTPAQSCGDALCEEINRKWSLTEYLDSDGTTRTALVYSDWYHRDSEESSLVMWKDPQAGCMAVTAVPALLGEHSNAEAAAAADSFWIVSAYRSPDGTEQLRWVECPQGLIGEALSSGTVTSDIVHSSPENPNARYHAAGSNGTEVRVVWCSPGGVKLWNPTTSTGTEVQISNETGASPTVTLDRAGSPVAAWETGGGVTVWRNGQSEAVAGAKNPKLERDSTGKVTLFYVEGGEPHMYSLHARALD